METEFVGVTGRITFDRSNVVVKSGSGESGSGWRTANGTTFCAMNLQAHASLGAAFVTLKSWMPDQWEDVNRTTPFKASAGARFEIPGGSNIIDEFETTPCCQC